VLPFVFIFNPAMLLIGFENWYELTWAIIVSLVAVLLFAAATMNYFVTRSRLWESAVLLVACFTMFRPDWWLDRLYPPYVERPAQEILSRAAEAPVSGRINMVVTGTNIEGEDVTKTVSLRLGDPAEPRLRLRASGLAIAPAGDRVRITNVDFGSYAKRIGLEPGYEIIAVLERAPRPSTLWPVGAAALATGLVAWLQARRRRKAQA
jgi:hypothetical protein